MDEVFKDLFKYPPVPMPGNKREEKRFRYTMNWIKFTESRVKAEMLSLIEKEAREFIPLYNNDGTGKHTEGTDDDYMGFIVNLILRLFYKS